MAPALFDVPRDEHVALSANGVRRGGGAEEADGAARELRWHNELIRGEGVNQEIRLRSLR